MSGFDAEFACPLKDASKIKIPANEGEKTFFDDFCEFFASQILNLKRNEGPDENYDWN